MKGRRKAESQNSKRMRQCSFCYLLNADNTHCFCVESEAEMEVMYSRIFVFFTINFVIVIF